MNIGGLDVATTTGFAVISGDRIEAHAFQAKGATEAEKLAAFHRYLRAWLVANEIGFCGIESPLMGKSAEVSWERDDGDIWGAKRPVVKPTTNPKTDAFLHAINRVAQMTCFEVGVPFETVAVATHRKSFLGGVKILKGMGKALTLEQCRRLGLALKSKDAADAVSVAWWASGRMRIGAGAPSDLFSRAAE